MENQENASWGHFLKRFDPSNNMVHNKLLVEIIISEITEEPEDLLENIEASLDCFSPRYVRDILDPLHAMGITSQAILEDFIEYLRKHYDLSSSSLFCNVSPKTP